MRMDRESFVAVSADIMVVVVMLGIFVLASAASRSVAKQRWFDSKSGYVSAAPVSQTYRALCLVTPTVLPI